MSASLSLALPAADVPNNKHVQQEVSSSTKRVDQTPMNSPAKVHHGSPDSKLPDSSSLPSSSPPNIPFKLHFSVTEPTLHLLSTKQNSNITLFPYYIIKQRPTTSDITLLPYYITMQGSATLASYKHPPIAKTRTWHLDSGNSIHHLLVSTFFLPSSFTVHQCQQ